MGDQGSLLVKLVGGGTTAAPGVLKNAIDFKPIPITLVGADLQRLVPNNASLNTVMHVVIKDDTAAVKKLIQLLKSCLLHGIPLEPVLQKLAAAAVLLTLPFLQVNLRSLF